jgi:hypothetical protein
MAIFSRSNPATKEHWEGRHRFEHWYRDNQVYLITSKTRGGEHVFRAPGAAEIFFDRFQHYCALHQFTPWVTTLMSNHYHTVGYVRVGVELKEMMRKLHGSIAKLVNDLQVVRLRPFWGDYGNRDYFDGCLRDETQLVRSYRYVLTQAVRARICADPMRYPNTRVGLSLEEAVRFAREKRALMYNVVYARYERREERKRRHATR